VPGHRHPIPRPIRALTVFAAGAVLLSGCGGGAAAVSDGTGKAPACKPLPPAQLPHLAGSLTQDDTGSYCLPLGARLGVFLTATGPGAGPGAPPSHRWSEITSSAPRRLAAANSGVLTPPLGVTPGVFVGVAAGTATLGSRTPDGKGWRVTIVVG
jgi:hypothetical protein